MPELRIPAPKPQIINPRERELVEIKGGKPDKADAVGRPGGRFFLDLVRGPVGFVSLACASCQSGVPFHLIDVLAIGNHWVKGGFTNK